jgi:hypothetical protein
MYFLEDYFQSFQCGEAKINRDGGVSSGYVGRKARYNDVIHQGLSLINTGRNLWPCRSKYGPCFH